MKSTKPQDKSILTPLILSWWMRTPLTKQTNCWVCAGIRCRDAQDSAHASQQSHDALLAVAPGFLRKWRRNLRLHTPESPKLRHKRQIGRQRPYRSAVSRGCTTSTSNIRGQMQQEEAMSLPKREVSDARGAQYEDQQRTSLAVLPI